MRLLKWTLLAFVALFVVLLLVTLLDGGVVFRITFPDAGRLAAGAPLELDGERIGRVVLVIPRREAPDEAIVRVATRHRERARRSLVFRLVTTRGEDADDPERWSIRASRGGGDEERTILRGEVLAGEGLPAEARDSSLAP